MDGTSKLIGIIKESIGMAKSANPNPVIPFITEESKMTTAAMIKKYS
ncbi:MAG: hypothetical protein Q7U08_08925 [Flavobacteriaceae bacterium]|nr:hypothetical protein [Flavobacteriaceae bacterium]